MNLDDYYNGSTHRSYVHGFMGFISYDLSAHQLNHRITIKPNQPCGYLAHYDIYLQPIKDGYDLIGMGVCSEFFQHITHQLSDLLCRCPPNSIADRLSAYLDKNRVCQSILSNPRISKSRRYLSNQPNPKMACSFRPSGKPLA